MARKRLTFAITMQSTVKICSIILMIRFLQEISVICVIVAFAFYASANH